MGTFINSPIQLTLMSGCEASRDAVALEAGSTAVGLVKLLETCRCMWANIGLAAVGMFGFTEFRFWMRVLWGDFLKSVIT